MGLSIPAYGILEKLNAIENSQYVKDRSQDGFVFILDKPFPSPRKISPIFKILNDPNCAQILKEILTDKITYLHLDTNERKYSDYLENCEIFNSKLLTAFNSPELPTPALIYVKEISNNSSESLTIFKHISLNFSNNDSLAFYELADLLKSILDETKSSTHNIERLIKKELPILIGKGAITSLPGFLINYLLF